MLKLRKAQAAAPIVLFLCVVSFESQAQWVPTNGPGDSSTVQRLIVSGQYLLAGTDSKGMYLSSDEGSSWNHVANGFPDSGKVTFIKSVGPGLLFAGVDHWGNFFYSTNNGLQWQFTGGIPDVVGITSRGSKVFVASVSYGVVVSSDSGGLWTFAGKGLPQQEVSSIVAVGRQLFVGTGWHGIFVSTDDGESWSPVDQSPPVALIWSFAVNGRNIFAGSYGGGVYRADSTGLNWTPSDSGIANPWVIKLVADGTALFAISAYGSSFETGIYVSTDNGTIWHSANTGLERISVESFAVLGSELFAGTIGRGVWKRPLSEVITHVLRDLHSEPWGYSLSQNYPNPFNPTTTIRYGLPSRSNVMLTVFNTLGQLVATLVNETQDAGYHDARFDGSGVASGVYFYRIQAGTFVQAKKFLLLR
jgi:hypothetical protein